MQDGVSEVSHIASGKTMRLSRFVQLQWNDFNARGKLLLGKLPLREGELMRIVPEIM